MNKELRVKNVFGEELDVLIEGNESAKEIIVFVHGFGTDKGEGVHLFEEMANVLKDDFLLVRFDQSGYGKSGGLDEEFQFQKAAGDLDSILRYVRRTYKGKVINIFAHSIGTFITSLLSPEGVSKTVFTGAINLDLSLIINKLTERIESKGGTVDKAGITIYPRTSGAVQRIGKDFWPILESNDMELYIKEYAEKTSLIVFKSLQDQIVDHDASFDTYKSIEGLKYVEIDGDHNFADSKDRAELFSQVKGFLENK